MKIDAILCDLGGVLIALDFEKCFHTWAKSSHYSPQEIQEKFSIDGPHKDFEAGKISEKEYIQYLKEHLKLTSTDEEIIQGWNKILSKPILQTFEILKKYKSRGVRLFVSSNTNQRHRDLFVENYKEDLSIFDKIYTSFEIGYCKPQPEFFDSIIQQEKLNKSNILFIDDTYENVVAARKMDIFSIYFTDALNLKEQLQKIS